MTAESTDKPHVFPEGRKPGEKLFAAITIVIGLLLLALLPWQTTWVTGRDLAAQPRLWPALSLAGTVLFGLLNLSRRVVLPRTPGRWTEALTWIRALEYVGWYLAYVVLIPRIGYLLATLAFCVLLTLRIGYRGRMVWWAAAFALAVVLLFKSGFNVKIPAGALYQYAPESIRYVLFRYF